MDERHFHQKGARRILVIMGMAVLGVIAAASLGLLFGFVVKWLWNWLMPGIFGLTTITFWQAWGLVMLSHILFKSFPHHNHNHNDDKHWKEKFHRHFEKKSQSDPPAVEEAS